ncbi:hypothetical protein TVAG_213780 [Trichomonas vaginalis G3]|uniref:Uncharacterized protein n=1 Tax=Trichomonas vaginalis (strain ATCC PRA-98 / G3) TaxID=412133 RepID=A2EYV9_TRIV3|nr:hypothetical protein TVAGG3_0074900 [Trichomonas vaginalis G3]XP_001287124.2 hypothetical protein TVAGG3_0465590 [Trichomonas vaginalis G3]XP_001289243.1 hypothetical protein TVAGG3_0200170 [Trichomonas vaginalis G3]XP_001330581.1 hypothetical protein TVAGG3_0254240 [Trichomonas vaginalis G3]XP_051079097.1 hypothetical protein TVAGG3_0964280 [Trichomonas vaginalis G3]EAX72745.1 hypothetical protein TVAG_441450 [Trichomonas vaginalis G3]EAX74249.1 hypothetical protein TVAG_252000 [Trichomon|eukprot:XP_001285675.1 hypothetical protein [Trichomonas vaginalis G3]
MGYEEDIAYVKSSMNFLTNAVVVFFCINLFIVLLVMLLFFCEVHGMINRDLPGERYRGRNTDAADLLKPN